MKSTLSKDHYGCERPLPKDASGKWMVSGSSHVDTGRARDTHRPAADGTVGRGKEIQLEQYQKLLTYYTRTTFCFPTACRAVIWVFALLWVLAGMVVVIVLNEEAFYEKMPCITTVAIALLLLWFVAEPILSVIYAAWRVSVAPRPGCLLGRCMGKTVEFEEEYWKEHALHEFLQTDIHTLRSPNDLL